MIKTIVFLSCVASAAAATAADKAGKCNGIFERPTDFPRAAPHAPTPHPLCTPLRPYTRSSPPPEQELAQSARFAREQGVLFRETEIRHERPRGAGGILPPARWCCAPYAPPRAP